MAEVFSTFDTITRGDTPSWNMYAYDDVGAINLTGYSIWFTGKKEFGDLDAAAIFQKTVGVGITVTNAVGGLYTITLLTGDTSALEAVETNLYVDIQIKSGLTVKTLLRAILVVRPDVTIST